MFIQTEVTPNPATLKFLPGRPVMDEGTFEARDEAQAERSPLAKALMQLPGVGGVFFANDFISVTKTDGEWQHLRPAVLGRRHRILSLRRALDRNRRRGFRSRPASSSTPRTPNWSRRSRS